MKLILNQTNFGWTKEENFTTNLSKYEAYSLHDEGRLVIAERGTKILKTKL